MGPVTSGDLEWTLFLTTPDWVGSRSQEVPEPRPFVGGPVLRTTLSLHRRSPPPSRDHVQPQIRRGAPAHHPSQHRRQLWSAVSGRPAIRLLHGTPAVSRPCPRCKMLISARPCYFYAVDYLATIQASRARRSSSRPSRKHLASQGQPPKLPTSLPTSSPFSSQSTSSARSGRRFTDASCSGGAFFGGILASVTSFYLGRRSSLLIGCVFFLAGGIVQSTSSTLPQIYVGRREYCYLGVSSLLIGIGRSPRGIWNWGCQSGLPYLRGRMRVQAPALKGRRNLPNVPCNRRNAVCIERMRFTFSMSHEVSSRAGPTGSGKPCPEFSPVPRTQSRYPIRYAASVNISRKSQMQCKS